MTAVEPSTRVSFREFLMYNILFLKDGFFFEILPYFFIKFTSKDKYRYFKKVLRQLKITFEVFSIIIE